MNDRVRHLSAEAGKLPPAERVEFVEGLLASPDQPDARIDVLWAAEAERWLDREED